MYAVEHLTIELTKTINYFRLEYNLSYAEIVGTLEILKSELSLEAIESGEDTYEDNSDY